MILRILLTLSFLAGSAGALRAEDAPDFTKFDVSVELRCLTLPQESAAPLIRRLRSSQVDVKAGALAELDTTLANGRAILQGWPYLTTHSGQKATIEGIEEIRYATEYQASSNNRYISDQNGTLTAADEKVVEANLEPLADAFETRNIGITFEVEPTVADDGKSVAIRFMASHVRLQSMDRAIVEHEFTSEKRTEKIIVEQPHFSAMKVLTGLEMKDGEQQLVGIFPVPGEVKQIELFILGVEVRENPPAKAK